jgi:peptidyl-prolyl cis-trans isomerase B (cyclophilin B)
MLCANHPASLSHFEASGEGKQKGRKLLYRCDKTYARSWNIEELEKRMKKTIKSFAVMGIISIALFSAGCEKRRGEEDSKLLDKAWNKLTEGDMETMIAVIETNMGMIKLKFYPDVAPNHCRNFIRLAKDGFYDNLIFHRVIKGFMIQGGCPQGTGMGGPGWNVDAEFSQRKHLKGTLSMARSTDPNSAGSQFFICLEPQPGLDGKYTVFGQVIEGQDVVDKIGDLPTDPRDRPQQEAKMERVYIEMAQ